MHFCQPFWAFWMPLAGVLLACQTLNKIVGFWILLFVFKVKISKMMQSLACIWLKWMCHQQCDSTHLSVGDKSIYDFDICLTYIFMIYLIVISAQSISVKSFWHNDDTFYTEKLNITSSIVMFGLGTKKTKTYLMLLDFKKKPLSSSRNLMTTNDKTSDIFPLWVNSDYHKTINIMKCNFLALVTSTNAIYVHVIKI